MDFQALCELADKEIRLGSYDRELMARALREADGVTAHAHQIYWTLRAQAIQAHARLHPGGDELYARELAARLDAVVGSRRLRANVVGWLWVLACVVGFVGAFIYFRAARSAFYLAGKPHFYSYAISGVVCVILAIVAYVICKRDAGHDPFAD